MSSPKTTKYWDTSDNQPVRYMNRLRDYYLALGYDNPYEWANNLDVPFKPLTKPLGASRIGLITTSAPFKCGAGEQGPGAPYNAAAKFYQAYAKSIDNVRFQCISHLGYDRKHSTAEDQKSFFPLDALWNAKQNGRIKDISPRFYGAPTNRSQVTTINKDCEQLLQHIQSDEVDVAILVPN